MKINRSSRRELLELSVLIAISIAFAALCTAIRLPTRVYAFLEVYTRPPVPDAVLSITLVTLLFLLYTTYRFWREALASSTRQDFIVGPAKDISAIKDAEKAKKFAMKEESQAIIDTIPDTLVVLDMDGRITGVNLTLTTMFGREPEELLGKMWTEMDFKSDDTEVMAKKMKELMETGEIQQVETVAHSKDGREIPISVIGSILRDEQGKPKYLICSIRDVSQAAELIEELRNSLKELEMFHVVALERELKMIKLKKEISNLKRRAVEKQ